MNVSGACNSDNFRDFWEYCLTLSVININEKAPLKFALPVYGYIAPVITLVTLVTNTFIVIVMSRRHLRTPTNTILLAMAVTELLTGVCPLPWSMYYYTFKGYVTDKEVGLPQFWCKAFSYFTEGVPTVFHNAAIWLTVFLAGQRYLYVCHTNTALHGMFTKGRIKNAIIILCVTSAVLEVPKLTASYYESKPMLHPNKTNVTYNFCIVRNREWVQRVGVNIFYPTYYWFSIIFVHTLPCLFLVTFTLLLVRYIKTADRRRRKSLLLKRKFTEELPSISGRGDECSPTYGACIRTTQRCSMQTKRYFHSTTRMLIVVIAIFLVIEIPVAIIFLLHMVLVTFQSSQLLEWYQFMNIAIIFRNLLILLSYPFNFAVYCGMSQQFRLTVRCLFYGKRMIVHRAAANGNPRASMKYSIVVVNKPKVGGVSKRLSIISLEPFRPNSGPRGSNDSTYL